MRLGPLARHRAERLTALQAAALPAPSGFRVSMLQVLTGSVEKKVPRGALVGVGALIAGGMIGQAESAQIPPGYSGSSTTIVMADNEEALRTLAAFANCYARYSAPRAFELLATEPGARAEAQTYRRLFRTASQNCLGEGTELSLPVAFVRGAIAEGLLERNVALPAHLILAVPAPGVEVRRYSEAARCYAAAHPAEVRALLAVPAGSQREAEALRALADDFFRCLPERAQGRRFGATQLRYLLAEALLRLPSTTASAGPR